MLAGLAITTAWVIWERAAFVGILDTHTDYRVTGPFSAMHRGGAFIECYLVVGSAFATGWAVRARVGWHRVLAWGLLAAASYAVMVTYSRNGQGALLVVALGSLGAIWLGRSRQQTGQEMGRLWPAGVAVLLVGAMAALVLMGPYARERLSRSVADLAVRQAHWEDALAMRGHGVWAQVFGEGLGSYPAAHFWRSREPVHAASYSLVRDERNTWLRLGAGATLYLDQIVARPVGRQLRVEAELRSTEAASAVQVTLCEKWMLTSATCASATLQAPAAGSAWQKATAWLDVDALNASQPFNGRPLKFSLATPSGKGTVDIDHLRLIDEGGVDRLTNGDFSAGMDRWFFSTDIDPPWHIHSMPVAVLFEAGWFGVVAWSFLLGLTAVHGFKAARNANALATMAGVAAAGFMVCASVNTLIDEPRFLALLLLMLWLAASGADRRVEDSHRHPLGRGAGGRASDGHPV